MKNRTKTSHYVPKSMLKKFSIDEKQKQVFAFDKYTDRSFTQSIQNAGSEKYFYAIRHEGYEFNFEEIFDGPDDAFANICKKIVEQRTLEVLTKTERDILIGLTVLQLLRTREALDDFRMLHNEIVNTLKVVSESWNFDTSNNDLKKLELSEEAAKTKFLNLNDSIVRFSEILRKKIISLCITTDDNPFWCSDNPVVQNNILDFGDSGLDSKGTNIYFPISKNCLVRYTCRSYLYQGPLKKQLIENSKIEDEFVEKINFKTVESNFEPENIIYFNSLQVRNASRFVYSNKDEFEMAKNYLADFPNKRKHQTKSQISFIKQDSVKNYPNKVGIFLIGIGEKAYHEIEISEWNYDTMIFIAKEFKDVESSASESKLLEVKLIEEGNVSFLLREMKIEILDVGERKFKLCFISPEMEKFIKGIK